MITDKSGNIVVDNLDLLHQLAGIEAPLHPLISIIDFSTVSTEQVADQKAVLNLYSVFLKKKLVGKIKYGFSQYDFEDGVLGMTAPGQILSVNEQYQSEGWWLLFHPDLIQGHALSKNIKNFGFFLYAVNEALHLSSTEVTIIESVFESIRQEYVESADEYSKNILISQLELLLNYSDRYYSRQFETRKKSNQHIITQFETMLSDYFNEENLILKGVPSVAYFSDLLHVSSHYLSDLLRKHTEKNTQQHIHKQIIEFSKEKLSNTNLSVSEIAYQVGFEYPQSFIKLFRKKTNLSPVEYRKLFR